MDPSPMQGHTLTVISKVPRVKDIYKTVTPITSTTTTYIHQNRLRNLANRLIQSTGAPPTNVNLQSNQGNKQTIVPAKIVGIPRQLMAGSAANIPTPPVINANTSVQKLFVPKIILLPSSADEINSSTNKTSSNNDSPNVSSREESPASVAANIDSNDTRLHTPEPSLGQHEGASQDSHHIGSTATTISNLMSNDNTAIATIQSSIEFSNTNVLNNTIFNSVPESKTEFSAPVEVGKKMSTKPFNLAERVDIIEMYFQALGAFPTESMGHITRVVSGKFMVKHGRPVSRAVINYHVEKFRTTGSILNDYSKSGRRPKEHPEIAAKIVEEIHKDDTVSIRQLMKITNSSYHIVRNVLRSKGYKSFKTKYPNTYVLKIPDYHGRLKNKDSRIINEDKPEEVGASSADEQMVI